MNCLKLEKKPRHDLAFFAGFFSAIEGIAGIFLSSYLLYVVNYNVELPSMFQDATFDWILIGLASSVFYFLMSFILIHSLFYVS